MTGSRVTAFRHALEDAGLSISEWARQNGVSRTHLYYVLDGDREPSRALASKIAAVEGKRAA